MSPKKRIAVIGAGAAGLASLDRLLSAGHDVVAIERRDTVGGLWNSGYEALHLITPRSTSMFDGYPQPESHPTFPSRDQVAAYMRSYARERGLLPHIRLEEEVLSVIPAGDHGLGGWDITTSRSPEPEHFDVVIVANGHLHHKYEPQLPGQFSGKVIHSADYRNTADIEGNRVLVLGAGNSGCDLAVDAAQVRKDVTISVRKEFTFTPKSLYGRARSELPIAKWHPRIAERITRELVRVSAGRPEQYPGLPRPKSRNLRKQRPIVNDLLPYWIRHGRITVKPAISRIQGKTVEFKDGSVAEYDTMLLATGFRYHAPFLDEAVIPRENDMPHRWGAGTLVDGIANLYFVGLIAPYGAQWPTHIIQAGLVEQFMDLQDRVEYPIVRDFQREDPGHSELELQRDIWLARVKRIQRTIARRRRQLGNRPPISGDRQVTERLVPSRDKGRHNDGLASPSGPRDTVLVTTPNE